MLVCVTNEREIASSSYLDCNAFESGVSRETCATANRYFHEILETTSEEYFWVPYSYSDSVTTSSTNKDPKMIYASLKDVAQHFQTICLEGRNTFDCGKVRMTSAEESGEASLVTGKNFWRKYRSSGYCIMANSRDDVLSLDKFLEETRNLTGWHGRERNTGILGEIESTLWKSYNQLDFAAQKTESSTELGFLLNKGNAGKQEYLEKGFQLDLYPGYIQTLAKLEGIKARERFSTRVARLRDIMGNPNPNFPSYLADTLKELFERSAPQRKADLFKNYPEIAMTL